MMVQIEKTPNPNTLKFLPGQKVSAAGPVEFSNKDEKIQVTLAKDILALKGTELVFFGEDFITVKKENDFQWEDLKPSIISEINDYYLKGNKLVISQDFNKSTIADFDHSDETIKKINNILDTKVRPAVARDGGDIKFKSYKDGIVYVELQGSCSGCPSSVMTLKQGVQNLLCHYVPEVKRVDTI